MRFPNARLIAVAAIAGGLLRAVAEDEVDVGHTAAGKLKAEVGFPRLELEASIYAGVNGYATGASGFHSVEFDDPGNDLYELSTESDFRLILLAKDPGMEVWNDHFSGFLNVGESFFVGVAPFDTHPIYNIVNGVPGNSYSLTFKVLDLNNIYTESDPFQLVFTPNPPVLSITNDSPNSVTISWTPPTQGFVLQTCADLAAANWTNAPSGITNPITLPATALTQFYRVKN